MKLSPLAQNHQKQGILNILKKPELPPGQLVLTVDIRTGHMAKMLDGVFAVGAILSQNSEPIFSFSAFSAETLDQYILETTNSEDDLRDFRNVGTSWELRNRFAEFLVCCLEIAWATNSSYFKNHANSSIQELFHKGLLLIIFNAKRPLADSFMKASVRLIPDLRNEQGNPLVLSDIDLSGVHALPTILLAKGYQPDPTDTDLSNAFESYMSLTSLNPLTSARFMTYLFYAIQKGAPQLDRLKIPT